MSRDLVVVGGGMTGAASALALAEAGFSVALVDAGRADAPEVGDPVGLRVSTLNPASITLLRRLGAWPPPRPERVQSFDAMEVWESDPQRALRFHASDAQFPELGAVVENALVQGSLWQALELRGDVEVHAGCPVQEVRANERGVRLKLEDGTSLRGRLLVAADGARSLVREQLEIPVERWDYEQLGLVAVVEPEIDHDRTARQRFLDQGPLAFLPLPNGQCSIVWSQSKEAAERRLELEPAAFEEELAEAFQHALGAVKLVSERAAFPLQRQRAAHYVLDGVVLIGDAAHVVHPLAGQGVNLGFLDVAALVEVLEALRDAGRDIGSRAHLRRYERWRVTDNELMADALHGLKAFYGIAAAEPLRRLGARWLNRSPLLRARFIEHASGYGGEVPRLVARGISD